MAHLSHSRIFQCPLAPLITKLSFSTWPTLEWPRSCPTMVGWGPSPLNSGPLRTDPGVLAFKKPPRWLWRAAGLTITVLNYFLCTHFCSTAFQQKLKGGLYLLIWPTYQYKLTICLHWFGEHNSLLWLDMLGIQRLRRTEEIRKTYYFQNSPPGFS